jgi:hypothetical protein
MQPGVEDPDHHHVEDEADDEGHWTASRDPRRVEPGASCRYFAYIVRVKKTLDFLRFIPS